QLAFFRCSLRGLQRIDRRCASESAPLSRWFLRARNYDVSAICARNAAFHHQQVFVLIDTKDAQVAYRHLLVSHVPRHAHAFEHTRTARRGTDRTWYLQHRTVPLRAPAKVMALHNARETAALAYTNDVHKTVAFEDVHEHALSNLQAVRFCSIFDFERN